MLSEVGARIDLRKRSSPPRPHRIGALRDLEVEGAITSQDDMSSSIVDILILLGKPECHRWFREVTKKGQRNRVKHSKIDKNSMSKSSLEILDIPFLSCIHSWILKQNPLSWLYLILVQGSVGVLYLILMYTIACDLDFVSIRREYVARELWRNWNSIEIQWSLSYLIPHTAAYVTQSQQTFMERGESSTTEFKATEKSYPLAKHLVGGASLRTRTSFELRLANHIQICQKSRRIGCVTHLRNMLSEVLLTSASPDLRDLESNLRGFHWGSLPLVNKWIVNYSSYWFLSDLVAIGFCHLLLFATVLPNPDYAVTVTVLFGLCDLSDFVTISSLSHGSHKIR